VASDARTLRAALGAVLGGRVRDRAAA
jgi:hypothetical protein